MPNILHYKTSRQALGTSLMQGKKALFFLYSSAGELDWTIPIVHYLLEKNIQVEIIYLSKGVKDNVLDNHLLSGYLDSHKQIQQTTLGWFARRARRRGNALYQSKLALQKSKFASYTFKAIDAILNLAYISGLSKHIKRKDIDKEYLIFLEFRNLSSSSNLRIWHERNFSNSKFFYFPHAPGVYMGMDSIDYPTNETLEKNNSYVMLGHPSDMAEISKDYDLSKVVPLYVGHPKYSKNWLSYLKQNTSNAVQNHPKDKPVKILVISRGVDTHLSSDMQRSLIDDTLQVVEEKFPNYQLIIKKHPRGNDVYWDDLAKNNSSITFTKDHILTIATQVEFAIAFWSSASMDCFLMGTPVIDFIDPKKSPDAQFSKDSTSTIFRALGVAIPADNKKELSDAIEAILSQEYKVALNLSHPSFQSVVHRSNQWSKYFEEALQHK